MTFTVFLSERKIRLYSMFCIIPSDIFLKTVYYFAQAGSNFEPVYIFEVIYGLQRACILLLKVIYGLKNGPRSEVIYGTLKCITGWRLILKRHSSLVTKLMHICYLNYFFEIFGALCISSSHNQTSSKIGLSEFLWLLQ